MSDYPEAELPDDDTAAFDFVKECIKTYRMCGSDVEQRIKALSLLKSVQPQKPVVKQPTTDSDNRSAVQKAQQELRRPK